MTTATRHFRTLDDLDLAGKRVLVRVDLNVPMADGQVSDATRLQRLEGTIHDLKKAGARIVLLSHFGRPKGQVVPDMSLAPIVAPLRAALQLDHIAFVDCCVGDPASDAVAALRNGEILLLENLRFHAGEEKNDPAFARQLAALGDVYVNDAFSAAHRAHASTAGIAQHLPAVAGRLMQAELEALTASLDHPDRPLIALVGGAKVSTKLDLLSNLVTRVDALIIGGGMANTFLHAKGLSVGNSLCEHDLADTARGVLSAAEAAGCEILLPDDVVVADAFAAGAEARTVPVTAVPDDKMILDIGPDSGQALANRLAAARSLVWNGPMGAFEIPPFDRGTNRLAQAAADLTRSGKLLSVAGGGDTVAALAHAGVVDDFSYVSTAGGAFLEWLEGRDLPGVIALQS